MRTVIRVLSYSFVVAATGIGCATTPPVVEDRHTGELSPTLQASNLLSPEALRGPNYVVDEVVHLVDHRYNFGVHTDFGTISASGIDSLAIRLHELCALESARRGAHSQLVDSVLRTLETGKKTNQIGAWKPGDAMARGVRGFGQVLLSLNETDHSAGGPVRRKVALQLGCDPESTNPVLSKFLDRFESKPGARKINLTTTECSKPPIPPVISVTPQVTDLLSTAPPHEVRAQIEKDLISFGVGEHLGRRLARYDQFSTLQLFEFTRHLGDLNDVKGRTDLVIDALAMRNEAEVVGALREVQMLASLHRTRPIRELYHAGLPVAYMEDGSTVVLSSYDYITNTDEVIQAVDRFRRANWNRTSFMTSGRLSPAALKTFEEAQVQVTENALVNR